MPRFRPSASPVSGAGRDEPLDRADRAHLPEFRETASLVVNGSDLPRCNAVLTHSLYRLLLTGQSNAARHRRYIIEPDDLPIPRGPEENITGCTRRGQHLDPERILAQLATHRPLDRIPAPHTEPHFPDLVGGLAVTLARTFTVTAPGLTPTRAPALGDRPHLTDLFL